MYAYIKGSLIQANPLFAVIDNGGIGYKIFTPVSLFSKLPPLKQEVILHVSFIVRELSQTLYGFLQSEERDLFDSLLNVTGVGPKMALNLIGHLSPLELQQAITGNDLATLAKVPGVGKKTAERLIVEMKDKVAMFGHDPSDFAVKLQVNTKSQMVSDAMSALINLGYSQGLAEKAIKKTLKDLPEAIDLSQLITVALKNM